MALITTNAFAGGKSGARSGKWLCLRLLPVIAGMVFALGSSSFAADETDGSAADVFTISLRGNPSTGYSWSWTACGEGKVREVEVINNPDKNIPGSPATFVYSFAGEKAGDVTLRFVYARFGKPGPNDPTNVYRLRVLPNKYIKLLDMREDVAE